LLGVLLRTEGSARGDSFTGEVGAGIFAGTAGRAGSDSGREGWVTTAGFRLRGSVLADGAGGPSHHGGVGAAGAVAGIDLGRRASNSAFETRTSPSGSADAAASEVSRKRE